MKPAGPAADSLGRLMEAAQQGDAMAYRELLHAVTPRIRRIVTCRRAFFGSEDVEDLVQDILLSLHSVRATYDPRRPFMPWLLAIIRNRLADAARKFQRTTARETLVGDPDVTFVHPATNPRRADDLDALDEALRVLPLGQRRAIELLKLEGFSLREAAAITGTTVGALRVATHRAMAALRKALRSSPTRT
jgi:RNA polymerase sigma factor (sigma-70 family)